MSFDALAPHYRWMEFILAGQKLHRCRTAFLHRIPHAANILLMGEGHGRALAECRRRFPNAKITVVDASAPMLAQARRRLLRNSLSCDQVEFIHADALTWQPPAQTYDLIATQFFLDCFRPEQLQTLVAKLAGSATANVNWLIADFQVAAGGWQRVRSALIIRSMYWFFRIVTQLPARKLTPPDGYLEKANFNLRERAESEWGLLRADWWRRQAAGHEGTA